jgi:hypothetical protein
VIAIGHRMFAARAPRGVEPDRTDWADGVAEVWDQTWPQPHEEPSVMRHNPNPVITATVTAMGGWSSPAWSDSGALAGSAYGWWSILMLSAMV